MALHRVCVFCGSSSGRRSGFVDAARGFGEMLARRGLSLVYGGGNVGLMGELAEAAVAAGAHVTGVIPQLLVEKERAYAGLPDLRVVGTMHERKATMAELSDAFVALPGGLGTLEELFETWTWAQLGLHAKPLGLLDVGGYYGHLIRFLDHAREEGFVNGGNRARLVVEADGERLLDRLAAYQPPPLDPWFRHRGGPGRSREGGA